MLKGRAPAERQVKTFRPPFHIEYTPYKYPDFQDPIRQYCFKAQTQACLKIAKVIFLGDMGVGKTSLIKRYCEKSFDSNYKATIGVDFEVEGFDVLGVPFNLQIWDTAGQERFKCIASSYYRATNVVVIVFDLSKISTLSNCEQWLDEALRENETIPRPYIILVGNKLDAVSSAAYAGIEQIAAPVADRLKAEFWAVSSKSGKNVKNLFLRIAFLAFESAVLKEDTTPHPSMGNIKIDEALMKEQVKEEQKTCVKCGRM